MSELNLAVGCLWLFNEGRPRHLSISLLTTAAWLFASTVMSVAADTSRHERSRQGNPHSPQVTIFSHNIHLPGKKRSTQRRFFVINSSSEPILSPPEVKCIASDLDIEAPAHVAQRCSGWY